MKKISIATAAPALALLASIGWGSSGMFNKVLVGMGFSPFQNSMIRPLSGMIILLPILIFLAPGKLRLNSWKDLRYFVLSGALGLAMCNTGYCFSGVTGHPAAFPRRRPKRVSSSRRF